MGFSKIIWIVLISIIYPNKKGFNKSWHFNLKHLLLTIIPRGNVFSLASSSESSLQAYLLVCLHQNHDYLELAYPKDGYWNSFYHRYCLSYLLDTVFINSSVLPIWNQNISNLSFVLEWRSYLAFKYNFQRRQFINLVYSF